MTDRDLGMHRRITRRDFLNGVALAIGGAGISPLWETVLLEAGAGDPPRPWRRRDDPVYPPALTGLRGSHAGSFEMFHALKDGTFWDTAGSIVSTRERYDLAVVGGGISGLAAAYYYRKAVGRKARIIILDNHDDFGGHAKRNEFSANGRLYLGFGGRNRSVVRRHTVRSRKPSSLSSASMSREAPRYSIPSYMPGSVYSVRFSSIRKPSGSINW